jgi:DNA polymerase elongation subunit (family B)
MQPVANAWQDRENVVVLYVNEAGQLRQRKFHAENVAYFKKGDVNAGVLEADTRILGVTETERHVRVNYQGGYWDRHAAKFVNFRRQHHDETGGLSLEADVPPVRRWLTENDIEIQSPRTVYFDIEVDSRASFARQLDGQVRVLSWALVADDWHMTGCIKTDTDDAERELFESLYHYLEQYDRIVAWNGAGYDFTVIQNRAKQLGVLPKDFRRWLYLDHLLLFKRFNVNNADDGAAKASFKLGDVAYNLLGDTKDDLDASKTWDHWQKRRDKLVAYMLKDAQLLQRIEQKTRYIELNDALCKMCRVLPDTHGLSPTRFVDAYLLRTGFQHDVHFRSNFYDDNKTVEPFKGAYVRPPVCNEILRNVSVCDLASLYPSIIRTWNLGPETKLEHGHGLSPDLVCTSPSTGLISRTDIPSLFAVVLERLMSQRKQYKKMRAAAPIGSEESRYAENMANSAKTFINSYYGCIGTPFSRYYDRDISEAITQNGVYIIQQIMASAESRGFRVVAGDTDSAFVAGADYEEFDRFVRHINTDVLAGIARDSNCRTNCLELAHEKGFKHAVWVAAKRYVGALAYKEGKRLKPGVDPTVVVGLEIKRSDTHKLGRDMQREVIALFVGGCFELQPYIDLVGKYRQLVLNSPMSMEDVVLSKSISKKLSEYVSKQGTLPVHVALAKKLEQAGEDVGVGTRIRYVITDATTTPMTAVLASEYDGIFDRHYIWENRVYPPSQRLLTAVFPQFDWRYWERSRPTSRYNPSQLALFTPASFL